MSRTDEASRIIAAERVAIWEALVDPSAVVAWLPPNDMTGRIDVWDARPGGRFEMTLTYPDAGWGKSTADSDVTTGRFVDLVPSERFVQEVEFDAEDPAFVGTMRMTWTLRDVAGGTEVVVRADDVPPGITAEDHAAGLSSSLANLAAHLESR